MFLRLSLSIMSLASKPDCVIIYFKMDVWCTTLLHALLAVSTTAVWTALGISLGLSVCFQTCPQVWQRPWRSNPVDLPSYATFFDSAKKVMPSLASLRSWVNSPFISCWRTTQQDLNMSYQNITKHRFKEELKCFPPSLWNVLPVWWPQEYAPSCPVCLCTADVSAAVYIRATGRLPDAQAPRVYQHVRVLHTGPPPPSWPWHGAKLRNEVKRWIQIQGI